MLATGEQIGRYSVVKRLGRGGMADVYLAKMGGPQGVEKLVVLKVIREGSHASPQFRTMFVDEARISMQLRHGNIVPVFDFGESAGSYFIAMEYVDGVTISRVTRACQATQRHVPPALALHIIAEVCKGLHHAHRMSGPDGQPLRIVHRDVSPQNVMVSSEGEVKLLDFGIARAASRISRTVVGEVKGKLRYMSPEQLQGFPVDARSDIYSAGLILFWLLTGQRVFSDHDDLSGLAEEIAERDVPPPSRVNPRLPAALDPVVMRALERSQADRYPDAAAFSTAISRELYKLDPPYLPSALAGFVREVIGGQGPPEPAGHSFERRLMQELFTSSAAAPSSPTADAKMPLTRNIRSGSGSYPTDPSPPPFEAETTLRDAAIADPRPSSDTSPGTSPSTFQDTSLGASPDASPEPPSAATTDATALIAHGDRKDRPSRPRRPGRRLVPFALGFAALGSVLLAWLLVSPATGPADVASVASPSGVEGADAAASRDGESTQDRPTARMAASAAAPGAGGEESGPHDAGARKVRSPRPRHQVAKARLQINADPWADVYWRGKKLGHTPLFDVEVPAGRHVLRFVNPDLDREKRVEFTVGPHKSKRIIVRMSE